MIPDATPVITGCTIEGVAGREVTYCVEWRVLGERWRMALLPVHDKDGAFAALKREIVQTRHLGDGAMWRVTEHVHSWRVVEVPR